MSNSVTLLALRTEIRNRGEFRSQYISDAELNSYINDSIAGLEDLVSMHDPTYFYKQVDSAMSDGVWRTALPADFLKMVGVSVGVAAGINPDGYQTLEMFNWEERHDHDITSTPQDTRWHVRGDYIYWNPLPAAAADVILEYIPSHTALSADEDTYNFYNHWQEWVVLDVAIKCCAKEETDPTIYAAQQQKVEQRIARYAKRAVVTPQRSSGATLTLSQLQLLARGRGNWTREQITDPQLTAWINSSISGLRDLICTYDPSYFITLGDLGIAKGVNKASLPSDFFKIVGASLPNPSVGSDAYQAMEQFNWEERWDGYDVTDYEFRYHVRGSSIYLHPTPWEDAVDFRIEYIPVFTGLAEPSDTTLLYNNWQEWVLLEVAIKACAVTGTDPQLYMAQLQKVEKRIVEFDLRDISDPVTSSDASNLQNLRLSVRARGNWDKKQLNDSQLTNFINSSISGLRDLICTYDPTYFVSFSDLTFAAGESEKALPSDFFKVVSVATPDSSVGDDAYSYMEQFNWNERWDGYDVTDYELRYHIRGNNLHLHPIPLEPINSVRVEYIPTFAGLSAPSDTTLLYNNWEEWVILDAAIKICALTGADPQLYMAQLQKTEKRIVEFDLRDLSEPTTPNNDGNTLQNLRLSIRARGGWDKKQLNDSQLTAWINSSISEFVDMLSKHDPSYYLTRSDISVVAGTREYDLPSNFYKMHGVAVEDSTKPDGYSVMERFSWDERYDYSYISDRWNTRYLVRGGQIQFQPTPGWTGSVRIEYISVPTQLVKPADTFNFRNGWEEWVILDVCVKICALLEANPQVFMAQLQKIKDRIIGYAEQDIGKPKTVADVNRYGKYDPRFYVWRRN